MDGEAKYTQVVARAMHPVLLKSDGTAAACGGNRDGQCDIPALGGEAKYTQAAAGAMRTVLLKSARELWEGLEELWEASAGLLSKKVRTLVKKLSCLGKQKNAGGRHAQEHRTFAPKM